MSVRTHAIAIKAWAVLGALLAIGAVVVYAGWVDEAVAYNFATMFAFTKCIFNEAKINALELRK